MNIASRVDSYISNLKKPWQDANVITSSVGLLECYISKKEDKFTFNRLWSKSFGSQVDLFYQRIIFF